MKIWPGIFCSWKWHFRQSVWLRSFSSRWLTEPCGEWQDGATLTHRLVLVHKRAALRGVALKAGFVSTQESQPAAFEHLLNICLRAFNCHPDMRVVAISAAHFAFQHRMMVR